MCKQIRCLSLVIIVKNKILTPTFGAECSRIMSDKTYFGKRQDKIDKKTRQDISLRHLYNVQADPLFFPGKHG